MAALINSSSYSSFINSRILDWYQEQGIKAVSVVQLTPIGASAAWCTNLKTWGNSFSSTGADDAPKGCVSRYDIIYHLFLTAKDINDKLLRSLQALDWETRGAARNAFSVTGQPNEWFHDIIQTLTADRLVWAYRKRADQDMRFLQVTHGVGAQRPTLKLGKFHGLFMEWRETVSSFVKVWESCQDCSNTHFCGNGGSPVPASRGESQLKDVLETLYAGIQESDLAKVENNFCRASLGLIALKLVRLF